MNSDIHIDEHVGVYALGVLSAADRADVDRHLASCEHCRLLSRDARTTVAALPGMTAPLMPAPELKVRLMARVDASLAAAAHVRTALITDRDDKRAKPAGDTLRRDVKWAYFMRAWAPAIAVASLLLMLAFGFRAWWLGAELGGAQAQAALLIDPAMRVINLPVASAPAGAQARLFSAPQSPTALLAVSALQQLPPAQTYEFWLIRDGKPLRAGIFNVDANGSALVRIEGPEPLGRFEQAGLTVERAGGVDTPTLSALVFIGAIR
jgi:anti-sigma-K factor RskA